MRSIIVGDETMSVLEIWGAEYQEQVTWKSHVVLKSDCSRYFPACIGFPHVK